VVHGPWARQSPTDIADILFNKSVGCAPLARTRCPEGSAEDPERRRTFWKATQACRGTVVCDLTHFSRPDSPLAGIPANGVFDELRFGNLWRRWTRRPVRCRARGQNWNCHSRPRRRPVTIRGMSEDRKKPTAGFWITLVLVAVLVGSGAPSIRSTVPIAAVAKIGTARIGKHFARAN